MEYIEITQRFALRVDKIYVSQSGTRYPYHSLKHYSDREFERIELARVVDEPPDFDSDTQRRTVAPVEDWPIEGGVATKLYVIEDLTPEEIEARREARRRKAANQKLEQEIRRRASVLIAEDETVDADVREAAQRVIAESDEEAEVEPTR